MSYRNKSELTTSWKVTILVVVVVAIYLLASHLGYIGTSSSTTSSEPATSEVA